MKNTKETQILQKVTLKEISAKIQVNLSIPVLYSGPRVIKDAVAALPVTRVQDTNIQSPRIQAANGDIIPWLTPG